MGYKNKEEIPTNKGKNFNKMDAINTRYLFYLKE